jgi:alpha-galactosidase
MYLKRIYTAVLIGIVAVVQMSSIQAKPLKVFILAGQSNMEGHAMIKTFPGVKRDPKTADIYKEMVDSEGKPIVCENVWIAYSHGASGGSPGGTKSGKLSVGWGAVADPNKIGPEYTFGIYMSKMLNEPILIIKTAWGGKSLYNDYRPPSAGENSLVLPKEISEEFKNSTGFNYKLMMDYVKEVLADPKAVYPAYDAKEGYELAGFVWFQGFNDLVGPYPEAKVEVQEKAKGKKNEKAPKDYSEYSRLLGCFIRDIRKELAAPKLPFVIGVLGVGGISDNPGKNAFRAAMAAPAETDEFKGSVVNVFSENYWPAELDPVDGKVSMIKRDAKRKLTKEKKENPDKEKNLSKEELKASRDKVKTDIQAQIKAMLTEEEMNLLENEMSNAGYHYYGSAKFFTQLGKAFAEALVKTSK